MNLMAIIWLMLSWNDWQDNQRHMFTMATLSFLLMLLNFVPHATELWAVENVGVFRMMGVGILVRHWALIDIVVLALLHP